MYDPHSPVVLRTEDQKNWLRVPNLVTGKMCTVPGHLSILDLSVFLPISSVELFTEAGQREGACKLSFTISVMGQQ